MPRVTIGLRRRLGWLVPLAMVLAGGGLIFSDRLTVWRSTGREWIADGRDWRSVISARVDEPLPVLNGGLKLPDFPARTEPAAAVRDLIGFRTLFSNLDLVVNWRELSRVGVADVEARGNLPVAPEPGLVPADDPRPFSANMDRVAASLTARSGGTIKFAWAAEPTRIVYLTSLDDLTAGRRWREQRRANASPALRRALDRPIPHVHFDDTTVHMALDLCSRVSGAAIDFGPPRPKRRLIERFDANYVTVERAFELVLRLRTEGDRLVVFEEGATP